MTAVFSSFHTFLSNTLSLSLSLRHTHTRTLAETDRHTYTQRRACKRLPQLGVFSFNSAPASAKPRLPRDQAANLTESTHAYIQYPDCPTE